MVKTTLKVLFGAALLMLALSAPVSADTIINFPSTCGSCNGNAVSLLISPTGGNNYTITLTINTAGNTASGLGIAAVNFKLDSGGGITFADLTDFKVNNVSGVTTGWSEGVVNSLSASGCGTSTTQGFGCSQDTALIGGGSSPLAPFNGSTYTWVWSATTSAAFNQATDQIHVGAIFGKSNSQGKFGQLLSEAGTGSTFPPPNTPVPEPGSLMLLGTGLVGLAGMLRRRLS